MSNDLARIVIDDFYILGQGVGLLRDPSIARTQRARRRVSLPKSSWRRQVIVRVCFELQRRRERVGMSERVAGRVV